MASAVISSSTQLAADHVAEDGGDLLGAPRRSLGGAVDLLQRVVELGVVEGHVWVAERRRVARIEGGVPLPVFVAEADDDDVGGADQRLGPERLTPAPIWSRQKGSLSSPSVPTPASSEAE